METKVLVVAPRFPAINQPWIDTYLEQLLRAKFEPVIFTVNGSSNNYHKKVDRLCLRERIVPFTMSRWALLRSLIDVTITRPRSLFKANALAAVCGSRGDRGATFLRAVHLQNAHNFADVQLIHSHAEIHAYQILPLAVSRQLPLIVSFHGLPPVGVAQLSTEKRQVLYATANLVLVNTEFAKRQVCALGCIAEKVVVLPQGIPLADFPMYERDIWPSAKKFRVLTVGRCEREKGHAYALLALRRLVDAGVDVRWTFIGSGPDQGRISRLIDRLRLSAYIERLDGAKHDELLSQYHLADFFVLPSIVTLGWQETQGVVLQEAQATGCIPIATATGGIAECIDDGRDGILVRQKSSKDIAAAIGRLIASPTIRHTMRQAGRRNVECRFSADVIGAKMSKIMHGLLTAEPRSDGVQGVAKGSQNVDNAEIQ